MKILFEAELHDVLSRQWVLMRQEVEEEAQGQLDIVESKGELSVANVTMDSLFL